MCFGAGDDRCHVLQQVPCVMEPGSDLGTTGAMRLEPSSDLKYVWLQDYRRRVPLSRTPNPGLFSGAGGRGYSEDEGIAAYFGRRTWGGQRRMQDLQPF